MQSERVKERVAIMENQQKRVWYLDYLRIMATIAVVVLHVAAQNWYAVGVETFEWRVFCVGNSLVRWAVPVFIMISGELFLNNSKPLSVEQLYKKYIWRLVTAFLFWSALYLSGNLIKGDYVKTIVEAFIQVPIHIWFMYMIVGLYMITPFLRKITESEQLTNYFLILFFVLTVGLPRMLELLRIFEIPQASWLQACYNEISGKLAFHFTSGYVGYYVLGYYLSTKNMGQMLRKICYTLGGAGLAATVLLTFWYSDKTGVQSVVFYAHFGFAMMCASVGIFTFAKYELAKHMPGERMMVWISKMSKYSFGVYLSHILVLSGIRYVFGISTLSGNPIVSVIGLSIVVLAILYGISAVLHHIPVLRKYVV